MKPDPVLNKGPFSDLIGVQAVASQEYFRNLWKNGPNGTKQEITKIMKDGDWKGKRCFIIGGGPSIRMFNFDILNEFLEKELSIGVNRAFQIFPAVKISVATDYTYYREVTTQKDDCSYKRYWKYQGIKLWVDHENRRMDNCYYIRSVGRCGLSFTLSGIYSHSNTGYSAIQIALALGASPIYLLGYDLCEDKSGHTHFHDYATTSFHQKSWKIFNEGLDDLARRLNESRKKHQYQIINLSPITAVKAFPKASFLRDVLRINQDNYFKHPKMNQDFFYYPHRYRWMHCYVSDRDLRSFGCRTVAQLENIIRKDDPVFLKTRLFLRRAA